jgi:hypothetical protein
VAHNANTAARLLMDIMIGGDGCLDAKGSLVSTLSL